ncbi:MAG: OmpP1/FadL family transporter [Candidatus Hydrogenedentota bacterium]
MRKACRPSLCSLWLAALLIMPAAWAQLQINSSPSKVGSGARALGMGSAFIAIADDATAASWNPGGLPQLERPEVSVVYAWKRFEEDFSSPVYRGMNQDNGVNLDDLNYASVVWPVRRTIAGRNLVFSLNYQRQFDFDRQLDFDLNTFTTLFSGTIQQTRFLGDYAQAGSLSSLSPALAFEITNRLSLGMAVNFYDQDLLSANHWSSRQEGLSQFTTNGIYLANSLGHYRQYEDHDDFKGTNVTLGALFKPTPRLSVGLVYHSQMTAEVNFTRRFRSFQGGIPIFRIHQEIDREITFPESFGVGLAYRFPNDKLTLSFDVTRTEWDDFIIEDKRAVTHSPQGVSLGIPRPQRTSGVTGLDERLSDVDPTYTLRLGMEYVFVDETKPQQDILPSIRAGVFYDPEPASGRSDAPLGFGPNNGLEPEGDGKPNDFYGVSLGMGFLFKNRINFDFAYQYRWGGDARKDTYGLKATDADVRQHYFYASTVIYF